MEDIKYVTKKINHIVGELTVGISPLLLRVLRSDVPQLFERIYGGEGKRTGQSPSENPYVDFLLLYPFLPRHPSKSRLPSGSRPPSMSHHSADFPTSSNRSPYEARESGRGQRVRSLTPRGSRRGGSIVSEGHTSSDEDGESRKKVGYASTRSPSVASSLGTGRNSIESK